MVKWYLLKQSVLPLKCLMVKSRDKLHIRKLKEDIWHWVLYTTKGKLKKGKVRLFANGNQKQEEEK